ncbi:MAG TPA: TIGR02281 family clan AA aspartic protease [Acetobacteraceae bacterium]|nr:TIGR02281 family clan AA aspartic protease [Acetobacteraceae bacterium]
MTEYRRIDDRLPTVRSRGSGMVPLLFLCLLLVLGAAAVVMQPDLLRAVSHVVTGAPPEAANPNAPDTTFASLYKRYGIAPLSASIVTIGQVHAALTVLQREPCDKHDIYMADVSLEHASALRDAALMLKGFAAVCPDAEGELYHSAELFYLIGDYGAAIAQASNLARLQPDNSNLFFLRARAFQAVQRYQDALEDYATSIRLSPDLKRVRAEVFMRMSESYAALGRNCEAMIPIEMYMSLDPDQRATPSLHNMLADLSKKGACAATFARGEAIIARSRAGVITTEAEVNGIKGRFIVDTGASFVSLTPAFAKRITVTPVRSGPLAMSTANGTVTTTLATATSIRLGGVSASTVPLVVIDKPLGNGIDGLLGMSFLSRFDITVTARELRLSAKAGK